MKIDQLRGMTQSVTEMIQRAGTQHAMAGEALSEYTAIAQTGARKPNPDDTRSTEVAAKERADRQQKEAKAAFKQWVQKQLTTAGAGMRKAFTGLFALGGPEALSAEKHLAQAMKQLNQVVGALKDEATSSYSVQDSNDIQIRRAKAHHFKAGSGFYVDGGPTVVLSAVSQVLRAHGFYIEADTLGVVADSEIHRLVNSYALDAKRLAMHLATVARIEAGEAVEIVTPVATLEIGGPAIKVTQGMSQFRIGATSVDVQSPIINLKGVVTVPGGAVSILPAPIPTLDDVGSMLDTVTDAAERFNAVTGMLQLGLPDTAVFDAFELGALDPRDGSAWDPAAKLAYIQSDLMGSLSLESLKEKFNALGEATKALMNPMSLLELNPLKAQLELDPVQPQSAKKAQTPLPQWKGRLPQPWAR